MTRGGVWYTRTRMFVREHTRYPVELAVRMKCSTWADYLDLHTSNLSRGGLFVPSRMSAPVGTEIAIELTLPNTTVVRLRGEVVHVSEGGGGQVAGMGIMFGTLAGDAQRALDEALRLARSGTSLTPPPPPSTPPTTPTTPTTPRPTPPSPSIAPPAPPAPSPPEARAPRFTDAVEQALLDELARRLDLLPHEQLGVAPHAGDAEIDEAYRRLKERYAPAIFARYGAATSAVVHNLNAALDAAHVRLMDPSERRALVIAAHQPRGAELSDADKELRRRGEEARAALRAGIERRVAEACEHRDHHRLDDAIRGFEAVLELDRKHALARAELTKLRDLKAKRKR